MTSRHVMPRGVVYFQSAMLSALLIYWYVKYSASADNVTLGLFAHPTLFAQTHCTQNLTTDTLCYT